MSVYWLSATSYNKHATKGDSEFHHLHQSKSIPANSSAFRTLHFWPYALYSQARPLHCKTACMHNHIPEQENNTSCWILPEQSQSKKKKKKILLSVSYRILKFLDARNLWMSQAQLLLEQTVAKDSIDGISAISLVHLFQCCTDLVNTFFSNI